MSDTAFEIKVIARIHTDLTSKFGIPRQSGLVEELEGIIVFEPEYRAAEALRGIEEWSPTVRPPRLGGNERVGVFATRSPFRPNSMGLSCVRLLGTEHTRDRGTVLRVAGADLMDGTPIFDIKPYLPLADCKPEASGGFTDTRQKRRVEAEIPDELADILPAEKLAVLRALLSEDPRPAYQDDPERVYGFPYAGYEVKFRVEDGKAKVVDITPDKEHL